MGKKNKNKKKGKGAEKTAMKTDKKLAAKQKKMLKKLEETDIVEVIGRLEEEEARIKILSEEICATPPTPRSNFTLVAHPEKEELILFGGEFYNGQRVCVYNDLFFYNVNKNEWKQIRSPPGPAPRSGHQMVAVATNCGQLWLFGGEYASPSQLQFYHYKDLWMMSLKTRKWEKITTSNGPSARSGHRMIVFKKKLFVFGGFYDNNQSYNYFNDVHIFSLESYTWLQVHIEGPVIPSPRSGCCMASTPDGNILVWGGYSKAKIKKDVDRGITHTDMYFLIPNKSEQDSTKYKWIAAKSNGYKPLPLSGVSCTSAPNGMVYSFGGVMDVDENEEDLHGQFGDDLLGLDLNSLTCHLIDIFKKKKIPSKHPKMCLHETLSKAVNTTSATTTDGTFTVRVAGPGVSASTSLEMPSFFPNYKSDSLPSPRMNAGLCVCKGILYVYGGLFEEDNKQYTFNDLYALNLHKPIEWKVIIPNNMNVHDWVDSESSDSDGEDDGEDSGEETKSESEMETE
uniref:Kelch domain-containing protein 4 n=1 Tax=Glossina palpalis gambiensis TaxID=67801 RepID=A0A1B0AR69_9MUSC